MDARSLLILRTLPEGDGAVIGISGFFWGMSTITTLQALYIISQKGLKGTGASAQQRLFGLVALLYLSSSAIYVGLCWQMFALQSPNSLLDNSAVGLHIAISWICRINYSACDVILVWRAWALWPSSRPVKILLTTCFGVAIGANLADGVILSVRLAKNEMELFPPHGGLLLHIPLLITNVSATGCIGYKAWTHRRSLKALENTTHCCEVKVEQVLALLVESGLFYCLLWFFFTLVQFNAIHSDSSARVACIWAFAMHGVCGMYPTAVVILVALKRTQQDFMLQTSNGNAGRLSPIHFRPRGELVRDEPV